MFKNSWKIMFIMFIVLSTFIVISANSWISVWMGLEINLLSFIPLMNDKKNILVSETMMKYFLIQAIASTLLLSMILMFMNLHSYMFSIFSNWNDTLIIPVLLKMGMAPFHFWFPQIIEGLSWFNSFILMTWQKISPLIILSYLNSNLLWISIILSAMIGAIHGLNQTSLQKILVFSSINHMAWMCSAMSFSYLLMSQYFLFYSFFQFTIILFLNNSNLFNLNQLFNYSINSSSFKIIIFFNFLSLGGLPPFLGFFPKWMIIQALMESYSLMVLFILIMFSMITVFFYLRMSFSSLLINSLAQKNLFFYNYNNLYIICSLISIFCLPLLYLVL
uniref:NADH dehydrogenase subunit 2 n=1 Tax=Puliciphora borinquenensis TaxID=92546 RepID=UPI001D0FAF3F|nr:NADH dehydrogenase subunit 2 [Puliciphora borinquenensis]QZL38250.1 NADH dehydrogenase subunit 2 [Puliciphora borinquenensis]